MSSKVLVHITYKDSYGKKHQENLSVDFARLKEEKRSMAYVLSPLDMISRELSDIRSELQDIKRRLKS